VFAMAARLVLDTYFTCYGVRLQAVTVVTLVYSLLPKSPNDSFGVNLLQWCENGSRRIL